MVILGFLLYLISAYQSQGPCYRADVDFNGRVNQTDLALVQPFFGQPDFPFWYDQDGDREISILDLSAIGGQVGQTCR